MQSKAANPFRLETRPAPPVYQPQGNNKTDIQSKGTGLFRLETRLSIPLYREGWQATTEITHAMPIPPHAPAQSGNWTRGAIQPAATTTTMATATAAAPPSSTGPAPSARVGILVPRERVDIDRAIDAVIARVTRLTEGHFSWYELLTVRDRVIHVKRNLVARDENEVNFENLASALGIASQKLEEAMRAGQIAGGEYEGLKRDLEEITRLFNDYCVPKLERVLRGAKISRDDLTALGVRGIDLGGTGLVEGYLDVNVSDPNSKNYLVIGDAMDLQSKFEPNCVGNVIAELLPLVIMEVNQGPGGGHTKEARTRVIEKVLEGVNYITGGGGRVSIKFNDNSNRDQNGDALPVNPVLDESELQALAARYRVALSSQSPTYRSFTFTR